MNDSLVHLPFTKGATLWTTDKAWLVHYNSELDFSGPFSTQRLKERYLVLPIAHAVCTLYYYSLIFGLFLRACHLPEVLINRIMDFLGRAVVKHPLARCKEMWIWSLVWEDPLKKEVKPTPVFLPGKSHEQRSLMGYSP